MTATDSRLVFLLFSLAVLAIGTWIASRRPGLVRPIYKIVDAGRLIIGVFWVAGIAWALFSLGGAPGIALAAIVLVIAGIVWEFEERETIK